MNKSLVALALCSSISITAYGQDSAVQKFRPEAGYVPNEETAIRIAVAVWEPIYGRANIASEKPYRARLENGIWFVNGSLPAGRVGGTAFAEISKKDGTIRNVFHGQ